MDELGNRLLQIFVSSALSFFNAFLFLFEFWLSLKFLEGWKTPAFFGRNPALARFVIAFVVSSLAFSGLNSFISKYIGGLLGPGVPLAKILLLLEALVFFSVLWLFYRRDGKPKA